MLETMIASALGLFVLAGILGTLTIAYKTQVFAQRESQSLDDARNSLHQFQRDVQGSTGAALCGSGGTCVQVQARTPSGAYDDVRYRVVGTGLLRDHFDAVTGIYTGERVLTDRIANLSMTPSVTPFTCTAGGGLMTLAVQLVVKPSNLQEGTFRINSTIRPRNNFSGC
jgi:hypothetical protein